MGLSSSARVTYSGHALADVMNVVEGYCATVHSLFGAQVQHYQQIDEKNIVPVSAPPKDWQETAAKIAVVVSFAIPVIPLIMFAARWAIRAVYPLTVQPPAYAHLDRHCYLKEAVEIRNMRENGVPNADLFNKKTPHHFRSDLPADLIIADLYLKEEQASENELSRMFDNIYNEKLDGLNVINGDLKQKRGQIAEEGFNGFVCVQGVEGLKGGIRNLLNIMLEGVVRGPYAGALYDGPSDCCAGPHGPFYIILNPRANRFNGELDWEENGQVAYLVPAEEHCAFLEETLNEAVRRGYITEEEKQRLLDKVITYDEFIALPHAERHNERALRQWLENRAYLNESYEQNYTPVLV